MNSKQSIQETEAQATSYIRANFEPQDRLAVVLIDKKNGAVLQRLSSAQRICESRFQAWLRHMNAQGHEVYVSMNALRDDALGRTKADIGTIRHVYLDFDDHGTEAVERLLKRDDLPQPNFLLNTSADKWQVIWKVTGFDKDQSEELQRGLARETDADIAATDCARVLRLPGFYNHKYNRDYFVKAQELSADTYGPERFPKFPADERADRSTPSLNLRFVRNPAVKLSQSERDWAYAKRALARGEPQDMIVTAIATHRRFEKHNPRAYAELTVRKAAQSLRDQAQPERPSDSIPNR
jgi:hypothetical protein